MCKTRNYTFITMCCTWKPQVLIYPSLLAVSCSSQKCAELVLAGLVSCILPTSYLRWCLWESSPMSVVLQLTCCVYILGSFFIHIECSRAFTECIMKPLETIMKIKGNNVVSSHQRQHCICMRSNYTCCVFVYLQCAQSASKLLYFFGFYYACPLS